MPRKPKTALTSLENDQETQIHTCWLYFVQGLTQQEVAAQLGLSRVKVTRLLQQARANGLVTITINSPTTLHYELQDRLCKRYALQNVAITITPEGRDQLIPVLANAAANFLANRLRSGMSVGIGNGRTISLMPQFFQVPRDVDSTFVELTGGPPAFYLGTVSSDVSFRMAAKAGGQAVHINTPYFVENSEARDILLHDPAIEQVMSMARRCDMAFLSVGSFDSSNIMVQYGILSKTEAAKLVNKGAAGDLLGRLIDPQGNEMLYSLSDRIIGLTLDDLRALPCCVLVAGGKEKVNAILAALRGGYVKILVTDVETAKKLAEG